MKNELKTSSEATYFICGGGVSLSYSSKNYNDSTMFNRCQELARVFKGLKLIKLENGQKITLYPTPEIIKLRQDKKRKVFEGFLRPRRRCLS